MNYVQIDDDKKISFLSNAAERLTEEIVTSPLEEEYDDNGSLTGQKYTEEAQEVFDGYYNELEEIFNKHFNPCCSPDQPHDGDGPIPQWLLDTEYSDPKDDCFAEGPIGSDGCVCKPKTEVIDPKHAREYLRTLNAHKMACACLLDTEKVAKNCLMDPNGCSKYTCTEAEANKIITMINWIENSNLDWGKHGSTGGYMADLHYKSIGGDA